MDPVGKDGQDRDDYFKEVGEELEAFLLYLQSDNEALVAYVENPVAFLNQYGPTLSDVAKAILLQSDYSVVSEIMRKRGSTPVRWVVSWVV
jgi:hypothetical protein